MDRIYQEKMVKALTGLAEGFAELAGLLKTSKFKKPGKHKPPAEFRQEAFL